MDFRDDDKWYVVYTKPKKEKKISYELSRIDIPCFLPLRKEKRQWSDRKKTVEVPLFPSYIFVRLRDKEGYYKVSAIEGVFYFVKFDGKLATIDTTLVEKIKSLISDGFDTDGTKTIFEIHQLLLIEKGALAGLLCEMVKYNGNNKALVQVKSDTSNLFVTVPVQNLSPVKND